MAEPTPNIQKMYQSLLDRQHQDELTRSTQKGIVQNCAAQMKAQLDAIRKNEERTKFPAVEEIFEPLLEELDVDRLADKDYIMGLYSRIKGVQEKAVAHAIKLGG